jgi:hypothetical protein
MFVPESQDCGLGFTNKNTVDISIIMHNLSINQEKYYRKKIRKSSNGIILRINNNKIIMDQENG